jgi:LysM repeat protein
MMNTDPLNELNPEDVHFAKKIKTEAGQINLDPLFESQLDNRLRERYALKKRGNMFPMRRLLPIMGWSTLAIVLVILTDIMIRSLVPNIKTQPGNATGLPIGPAATLTPARIELSTPAPDSNIPNQQSYDWRGTRLTLAKPLPESPLDATVYQLKPDHLATLDKARALAEKFGLGDEVYQAPGQVSGTTDYFFTDGKQSLSVNSNLFFLYTADMVKAYNYFTKATNPNAENIIRDFLSSHGFDFPYKVETDELYGGYVVEPLSPDGFVMRYEWYSSRPMLFTLDENGQILRFEANLMDYESTGDQKYSIISADEAFQKILDQSQVTGMIESAHSESQSFNEWRRAYPENQDITFYGYVSSIPALDAAKPSFVQIDAYTASGNINGLDALQPNSYVEATGQFMTEKGVEKFNVSSWKSSVQAEEGFTGTIRRDGQNIILATDTGNFILPDVPVDMPLPFDSAYVVGVKIGDTIDWKLIDDRMGYGGVGGGGGGGLGFYKLNLSGTPVLFPTSTPEQNVNPGETQYTVKAGDTLSAIAQANGITIDELMKANNITDPGMIYIDQQLVIPGMQPTPEAYQFEKQPGMLTVNIYKSQDGSQRVEYGFSTNDPAYPYSILEGDNLDELQNYHNRPVEIWGITDGMNGQGIPVVKVSRFEIPYPDLKIQIMKGTEKKIDVRGISGLLLKSEDGNDYVQLFPNCYDVIGSEAMVGTGKDGEEIVLEALKIPNLTFGDYPAICVFSTSMAFNPKDGKPVELTVTADQPYVMDEPIAPENYTPPTATIEKVELIYFVTNQHWQVDHLDGGPQYIQPIWKFSGHYSNGDVFEILVQALKQEYLLPELAPYVQPG